MKQKTAIIFPGIGYHCDKPLLYYGKKLASEYGYRIVEVPYTGFRSGIRGKKELMEEAYEHALSQTEGILKTEEISSEDELLWISKSIGTAVAASYQKKYGLHGKNIYFTPVEQSFELMRENSGIVFHGTGDPWVTTPKVIAGCERLNLPLYITDHANHSLETGDLTLDIPTLYDVINKCRNYIK